MQLVRTNNNRTRDASFNLIFILLMNNYYPFIDHGLPLLLPME